MPTSPKAEAESQLALRAGAASVYLVVGLLIGVVVAISLLTIRGFQSTPSFATVVFGVTAVSAVLAASFPITALASVAPLANFAWGFINGSLVPESITSSERRVGVLNQWLFWLAVVAGIAFLLALLLR